MWLGSPLLVACSWSASDQQPCSICLSPALPTWVASCVRLQARSGGEAIFVCFVFFSFFFWRGGGGSTMHCHRNYPEVSRTYGNTQFSTSRMLREYLAYDTPCAHIIVHTLTTTQSSHSWRSGPFGEISPWLAMLTGCPDLHNGRRSAYSSTNSWASNRFNLYEQSVQLTLHERLRTLDLRVLHSPCHR